MWIMTSWIGFYSSSNSPSEKLIKNIYCFNLILHENISWNCFDWKMKKKGNSRSFEVEWKSAWKVLARPLHVNNSLKLHLETFFFSIFAISIKLSWQFNARNSKLFSETKWLFFQQRFLIKSFIDGKKTLRESLRRRRCFKAKKIWVNIQFRLKSFMVEIILRVFRVA